MEKANERAYNYIKEKICNGHFKPAQRLIESQLAEEIGVSRNTIKNTLLKIEHEKLVVVEKNKGAYVRSLDIHEIDQYMEVREALEAIIIRYAVEAITDMEIKELEAIMNRMSQYAKEKAFDEYSRHNRQFHQIIYNASKCEIITKMILEIKTQMIRSSAKTMYVPERAKSSEEEHRLILEAIRERNADKAERAIRAHMHAVGKTIHQYKELIF